MPIISNLYVRCPGEGEPSLPKLSQDKIEVYSGGAVGDFNFFRFNGYRKICEKKNKVYDSENRSLLIMSLDIVAKLNEEGWPVKPGDLGENLSIDGAVYSSFESSQKYRAGSALFELTEQANPCKKLAQLHYVGEEKLADFMKTMVGRRGWYAKVLEVGEIKKGDELILV